MNTTIKLTILTSFVSLCACSAGETTSSNGGAASSTTSETTTTTDTTSTTSTTMSETTTTTDTTTTTSTFCIGGPKPCEAPVADGYPDPLASFVDGADFVDFIHPIVPDELGQGAAAARLGPWNGNITIAKGWARVVPNLSFPARFAVWTEPQCGLPADPPGFHTVEVNPADVEIEPQPDGSSKMTWTLPDPVTVPEGGSAYVALMLTQGFDGIAAYVPTGPFAPRSLWYGLADNDCDGKTDAALGWAYLDYPSDPNVAPYHYDEAFGLILQ